MATHVTTARNPWDPDDAFESRADDRDLAVWDAVGDPSSGAESALAGERTSS